MADLCRHAKRHEVIEALNRNGWNVQSETAKAVRFESGSFSLNFNGEDASNIDLIFDPILAGANFEVLSKASAESHERFSSNFRNFPKKVSKNGKLNHFGVGFKFSSIAEAEKILSLIQLPEVST